ncbi:FAD-dependent oxidoreductase [Paremcibacter congregatus]|uniref:Amine oxidase domain-containing protein n=1 Tax=Paremcibacter congregatus TaxID=2043170 RepID=A0A2G4YW47_9PROT|nr:FAD-dependent oxidoreductase [Paremcibacter congregatus]PHZ86564.1 hypothetical protein CRD36_01395 [Paremcibacter congregatus]QDE26369.1 FAD-dependent oxidoreductase [Paremcibacter congregatus]
MTGIFPSLTAFGGTRGLLQSSQDKKKRPSGLPTDKPLSELMSGNARMVDTYIYEYVEEVVRNDRPFATLIQPRNPEQIPKVAIIGSGVAGATAAYELSRAYTAAGMDPNLHIDIYEALDRAGGRLYSPSFTGPGDKKYYNEMGAMRVPDNSKLFWNYFAKLETRGPDTIQEIFPNPGVVATEIYFRGGKYSWIGNEPITPAPDVRHPVDWSKIQDDLGSFIGSLVLPDTNLGVNEIAALLTKNDPLTEYEQTQINEYWSFFIKKYEAVPFISALTEYLEANDKNWGPTEYNMFSTLGLGTGGFGPLFPVCFLEIFRLLVWEYNEEFSLSMPMDQIIGKFLNLTFTGTPDRGIPAEEFLEMNTVVYIGLDAQKQTPVVFYMGENNDLTYKHYDYVIAGTTLRSMQIRLNLDAEVVPDQFQDAYNDGNLVPVFSGEENNMVRESMRVPHIMNSSKLFGFVPQKPWTNPRWEHRWGEVRYEGKNYPVKCVLTDTLARQMYFLDPYKHDDTAGSNILISYNWGDDSIKVMGILDYHKDQVITPGSNPDFNLKTAYELGIGSALRNNVVADVLRYDIPLAPDQQEINLQSIVWQKEPMMFGAFKIDYPEQHYYTTQMVYQYHYANEQSTRKKRHQRSNRVFVANNNCSFQGGWVEGAMQSAVNAATAVLKSMEHHGEATGFRMNSLFQENPFNQVIQQLSPRYALPGSEEDEILSHVAE